MKKIYNFIAAACAIAASASCAKEVLPGQTIPVKENGLVQLSFTASLEGNEETKAILDNKLVTTWSENDSIAVIDGANSIRVFKIESINEKGIATFTGTAKDTTAYYAVYPYSAAVSAGNGTVNVTIPSTQSLAAGELIDPAALISTAFTTDPKTPMAFKNAVSLAKVTVPEGTVKAKLSTNVPAGASAPSISGDLSAKVSAEAIDSLVCTGGSSVALVMDEGAAMPAGTYFMAVAPSTLPAGMQIILSQPSDIKKLSTDKSLEFVRNGGLDLGDVAANAKTVNVPFVINSVEDFITFGQNASLYGAADVVKLGADLDFNGAEIVTHPDRYYGSIDGQNHRIYNYQIHSGDGTLNATDAAVFGRIGSGSVDKPYYIKNIAFGSKDYDFATGKGTYDGTSKVTFGTVANGSTTWYYPGCVAYVYAYGTCENLVNFTPVEITSACTCNHRAGALLGTVKVNVTIKNCKNYGDISDASSPASAPTVGGIVGALDGADSVVENCENYGNVTIKTPVAADYGGLVGYDNYVATFKNCRNYGNVTADYTIIKATHVGGITSRMTKNGNVVENCENHGNISLKFGTGAFDVFAGGITGRFYGGSLTNCDNSGEVDVEVNNSGKALYVGGCFGCTQGSAVTIKDSDNSGKVSGKGSGKCAYVGGVNGYTSIAITVTNCHNTGDISHSYVSTNTNGGAAGVVMFASKTVKMTKCTNTGAISTGADIKAKTFVGGIAGIWGSSADHQIDSCRNDGTITINGDSQVTASAESVCHVGGVAGAVNGATIKNSSNKGDIVTVGAASPTLMIGGVCSGANYSGTELNNCKNEGNISIAKIGTFSYSYAGGVLGALSYATVKDCSNTGNITSTAVSTGDVTKQLYVGGLAAVGLAVAPLVKVDVGCTGCSVNSTITVDASTLPYAGMVMGRNAFTTAYTIGTVESPILVSGSINGTAAAADNLMALGSGNTDSAGTLVTINAALAN